MNIQGITADVWAVDATDSSTHSQVPDLDIIIPTAGQQHIVIILVELESEDSVGVTGLTGSTTFESHLQLPSLFIVHSDDAVGTTCGELSTIRFIVDSEELVELVVDGVKEFA